MEFVTEMSLGSGSATPPAMKGVLIKLHLLEGIIKDEELVKAV